MPARELMQKLELRYGWGALPDAAIEARSADLLEAAASIEPSEIDPVITYLVQTRAYRNMASPKEITDAIAAVRQRAAEKALRARPAPAPRADQHQQMETRARAILMASPMAREALADGWFGGLWDFVFREGRLPVQAEVGRVKSTSLEVASLVDEALSRPHNLSVSLEKLAGNIRSRYARLAEECGLQSGVTA